MVVWWCSTFTGGALFRRGLFFTSEKVLSTLSTGVSEWAERSSLKMEKPVRFSKRRMPMVSPFSASPTTCGVVARYGLRLCAKATSADSQAAHLGVAGRRRRLRGRHELAGARARAKV